MNGHQLMDFAAALCGILTATGLLGIAAIFGLYRLEEWLNAKDESDD